jgi:B12-binding domain/radical SAM domain protein
MNDSVDQSLLIRPERILPAMQVNWRWIHAARNSFAVLHAACERDGIILQPVDRPADRITCYSLNSINAPAYRDEIACADCLTIAGGPHATACPREVAGYADYVVVGEAEYTLPRLLEDIRDGGEGRLSGVMTGSFYEPAKSSVRLDAYPAFSEMLGYVEISRGCPHACGYCQTPQIFGHCMRHRSIMEVARFANRHGQSRFVSPNAFAYGSDGVHPRWDKLGHLLRACRQQIFFGTFPSEVRPEFVCDESLSLVTRYCTNTKLHFGAQSGSDAVLEKLRRGHTVADVLTAVDLCREYALEPVVDFIVGLPFESDDDQQATLDLIIEISRHGIIHVHRFIPLPGTPLAGDVARDLLPGAEKVLGKLALRGRLTGSWNDPAIRFFRHPSNDIP